MPAGAELPRDDYSLILGGDLGWNDQKTIVALACSETTNALFFVDCFARSHMLIDDYAATLKEFIATHKPVAIVCDAGALGKDIVEQLKQKHAIPVLAAEKTQKPTNIAFLNSALRKNIAPKDAPAVRRLRFTWAARAVWEQMRILQWADKFQKKVDQAFREDLADAALYAFRYATNVYKPDRAPEKTPAGTAEHADEQARLAKERALRRARLGKNGGSQDPDFDRLLGS
jgi:hypothetical protein